jgi:transcriptional regulator with XRE-family HTH domain
MAGKRSRVGQAFGIALREAREAAGITQEELAGRASYGPNHISLLETAKRQPTISSILALEGALSLAPGDLVKRTHAALASRARRPR